MKKIFIIFAIVLSITFSSSLAYALGSCTETINSYVGGKVIVKMACTGDAAAGTVPDKDFSSTAMALIQGTHFFYYVQCYPTSGGTAPDAADVLLVDANGEDYLGSADGTTAVKGLNLIHATLPKSAIPYSANMATFFFFPVNSQLKQKVSNQATASANWTCEYTFDR